MDSIGKNYESPYLLPSPGVKREEPKDTPPARETRDLLTLTNTLPGATVSTTASVTRNGPGQSASPGGTQPDQEMKEKKKPDPHDINIK
jgi:hypothetical protein